MRKYIIYICIMLLAVPQFVMAEPDEKQELIREIKTFTIFEVPEDKDYLFAIDASISDISSIKKHETEILKIGLTDSQKTDTFKPGDIVESISFRKTEPPEDGDFDYINCDFAIKGEGEIESKIFGVLYSMNLEKDFFIVESNLKFHRVTFDSEIKEDDINLGDNLEVTGKSVINRPLRIKSASYKVINDERNNRVLRSCKISRGGWHDGLFRVKSNNEYWQVNFTKEQPNQYLKSYMKFAVKGVRDYILEQTLHECVLLDILSKRNIAGKITEVLPAHGIVTIVDTKNWVHRIATELPESELMELKVDDVVRASGYQVDTREDLPLLFADIFVIDEDKLQPVSFSAEIYDLESCEKDGVIAVDTGKCRWNILTPEDFNCDKYNIGDWVSVEGSIQSFSSKIIKAETLKSSKVIIHAEISSNSKKGMDTIVTDLFTRKTWYVEPSKGGKSFFRRGDIYQVKGDLVTDSKDFKIENATFKKLTKTKGQITAVDSYNQKLTIKNTVNREMIIDINPEWYNIDTYEIGEWVELTGLRTKKGLSDVIINILEKIDR